MLLQMTARLHAQVNFESAIEVVLDDVVALHGAEFGDVQLPIGDDLLIVAQRNFSAPFLEAFRRVRLGEGCVCGRALRARDSLIVPDIETDADFRPFREHGRAAGFRGCQSTPIFAPSGTLIGMVSTHFANPHEPTPIEMNTLGAYARIAGEHLHRLLGSETVEQKAWQMNASLYSQYGLAPERPLPPVNEMALYDKR